MSEKLVPLKVTFDAEADAAYIYLVDKIDSGGVRTTVPCDLGSLAGMINLDFDDFGQLLGIEIMDARHFLAPQLLS